MKKLAALLSIIIICISLSSCSSIEQNSYYLYLSGEADNFDPLISYTQLSNTVIGNVFEGLFILGEDGAIVNGCLENYTVSEDQTVYNFILRDDIFWSSGVAVTSDDFLFTFQRMFDPQYPSVLATEFLIIKNSTAIINNKKSMDNLGIEVISNTEFSITLKSPSASFLELLATQGALPCNREFFYSTDGRYGLSSSDIITNGPFIISYVGDSFVNLVPSSSYYDANKIKVEFVKIRESADVDVTSEFLSGSTNIVKYQSSESDSFSSSNAKISSSKNMTWIMVFNTAGELFSDVEVRRAFLNSFSTEFDSLLTSSFQRATTYIPPTVTIDTRPYSEVAGGDIVPQYNGELAEKLLRYYDKDDFVDTRLLMPQGEVHEDVMSAQLQVWQKDLNVFFNASTIPLDELLSSVASGDYDIAVYPVSNAYNSPDSVLSYFTSNAQLNISGYANTAFDSLLSQANSQASIADKVDLFRQAELILIEDAVCIPMYYENNYIATANDISGLVTSPSLDRIYFRYLMTK